MQRRLGEYVCGRELLPASHPVPRTTAVSSHGHLSVRGYDDDEDDDDDDDGDDDADDDDDDDETMPRDRCPFYGHLSRCTS